MLVFSNGRKAANSLLSIQQDWSIIPMLKGQV